MFSFAANWPDWLRSFVTDVVETGLTALFALNLVIPGDLDAGKAEALVVFSALVGAVIAAARRTVPKFMAWLRAGFGTETGL